MAKYGWSPDLHDQRDFQYKVVAPIVNLPLFTTNRLICPAPYDQFELGSCTGNSIAGCLHYDQIKQKEPNPFTPSRLFIYYNERVSEGTVNSDSGAQIRDGIKSVATIGACKELTWPYNVAKFTKKPTTKAYTEAAKYKAVIYSAVGHDINSVKQCLASGDIFAFGFTVYESFESEVVAKTGIMPIPQKKEKVLGGHAVEAIDYDDAKECIVVRNSWGTSWGDKGYFFMPYAFFFSKAVSDLWVIKTVS